MMPAPPSTPKWMIVLIVIILLPVFQFPFLLSDCPDIPIVRALLWIYPFYCLVAAYLAYQCYPQRHALVWILLLLMIMSHVSVWLLATTPLGLS